MTNFHKKLILLTNKIVPIPSIKNFIDTLLFTMLFLLSGIAGSQSLQSKTLEQAEYLGELIKPSCDPNPDIETTLHQTMKELEDRMHNDPLVGIFGLETNEDAVRLSIISSRDICRDRWKRYRVFQERKSSEETKSISQKQSGIYPDEDPKPELLGIWAIDCNRIEDGWFALEQQAPNKHTFVVCAGTKCIPYPGFREPFNAYADERVHWLSETEIEVKHEGIEKHIRFSHCTQI